jgi:GAF domain-containing protein
VVPLVVDEVVTGGFYLTWWERARTVTDAEAALLHTVGLHTGLFLRSARLHAERETRNQRLRTLIQLNQVVSSTLDSGSILTSIAQAAARLIDAHLVRVWMADDRRRRLTLAAMSRVPGHEFPLREFGYDEGATGWVARHRQLLEIDDVFTEGSPILHPEWWRSEGVKTYLGVARPKATGSATVAGPFEAPIFSSRCRSGKTSAGL